ncbi:hypothetical protein POTOM_018351 [Populus tomentosa]|uniref:Uncharacterized protein n=1 Tax=Populus tomentosa TaxID=118781 RepID=A0A8X7ZZ03_POPTO|nr:hypothetical protein POTOM_018351 [Populus tomentosa]
MLRPERRVPTKSTVSSEDTLFPENHSSALHKVIHESVEEEPKPISVVYICLGSMANFTASQLKENAEEMRSRAKKLGETARKCGKSSGSLNMKEKHKKKKSVKQLETEEVGNSDKPVIKTVLVGIKRMDARAYRELFKQKQKKAKLEGSQDLIVNRTPGVDTEVRSGCKVMSSKQKRSIDDLNFDATEMVSNEDGDAAPYKCGRTDSVDSCSERKRLKKRNKVSNNNTDSLSLKAALIGNWLVSLLINCSGFVPYPVCTDGTSGAPVHKMSQVMPSSSGLLNTTDANHVSNFSHLTIKLSQVLKADMVGYNGGRNLHDDSEKSLHLFLKPEIAKLCENLQLPVCISSLGRS